MKIRTVEELQEASKEVAGGCWEWPRGTRLVALVDGEWRREESAPRAAFLLAGGILLLGEMVWRSCGNAGCVRPQHLRAGRTVDWHRERRESREGRERQKEEKKRMVKAAEVERRRIAVVKRREAKKRALSEASHKALVDRRAAVRKRLSRES